MTGVATLAVLLALSLAVAVAAAAAAPIAAAAAAPIAATSDAKPAAAAPAAADAPFAASWPLHVQPFFLSATNSALTAPQARYIGRFPVAVINHKQSLRDAPPNRNEERKQLDAIAAIKRANASCTTLFYLNSKIDFTPLDLHQRFAAANGSWWLMQDDGTPVWQNKSAPSGPVFQFDLTVRAAQRTWVAAALAILSNSSVDGIFVDKAGADKRIKGVSAARVAAWNAGHDKMLADLRRRAPPAKLVVLNNRHEHGEGQLFERWGNKLDHDLLNITADVAQLTAVSRAGLLSLARAGGVTPGSGDNPDPQACAAGLAAMLVAVAVPDTAFFSCAVDFRSDHWLSLLNETIYALPLGAPVAARAERDVASGLLTRSFSSGTVAVLDPRAPNLGCVKWAGGKTTTGTCPGAA